MIHSLDFIMSECIAEFEGKHVTPSDFCLMYAARRLCDADRRTKEGSKVSSLFDDLTIGRVADVYAKL